MRVFGPQQHETAVGQGQEVALSFQHRQVALFVVRFQFQPMQGGVADPLRSLRDELQIDIAAMGFPEAFARGLGVLALHQGEERIARQGVTTRFEGVRVGGAQEIESLLELLRPIGILEMVRTGQVVMMRGNASGVRYAPGANGHNKEVHDPSGNNGYKE